ncbi:MAG: c-type cytochrome [Gammaproteobacteria bacterium]
MAVHVTIALCGCENVMQDMYDQPRYEPQEASPLFADGLSSRTPIAGTIAQSSGALADAASGTLGASRRIGPPDTGALLPIQARDKAGTRMPMPVTLALLKRGRERYDIYCAPCHSRTGNGDGMIVRSGYPAPPSYHTNQLRNAPIGHFFNVITYGYGVMYSYASRVAPHDRWAIAAYVRALQLSRHARLDDVPASQRHALDQGRQ